MTCKHKKIEGNTTKYFFCKVFDKTVDDYRCKNCLMKLNDDNKNINELFEQIFGKGFEK